jgi:A/G-specific adenine glycosylase
LQQTQVARVLQPYDRFIRRFPSPAVCAAASGGEVIRAWSGLGYNRRALNLHRAATVIVERHGGAVPASLDELRALPGVGPYTARAVLAFAFGADHAVVDANIARLLARSLASAPLSSTEAQALADDLVPRGRGWLWNQALMDIGALFCTARNPDCARCPLAVGCLWWRRGRRGPDPGAAKSRQGPFAGSDRQGRGRLVASLRRGPVASRDLAEACGWAGDPKRALGIADALVEEGLARRDGAGALTLP